MKINLTPAERSALLSVLHGAIDDVAGDENEAPGYIAALHSAESKIREAGR